MIRKEALFSENILNIFTDASITNYGKEIIGCPGYIAVIGDQIISERKEIIRNSTNNNSEIIAIALAVEFLYYSIEQFKNIKYINLFSDSKVSIFGLREWFLGWLRYEKNGCIYNSSGEPVANQDVFIFIINMIMKKNIQINLYHQNGHINNTSKSLEKAYRTFVQSNGIVNEIDIELIKTISYYNNMIDNNTREYLLKTVSSADFKNSMITNYYFHHHIYNNEFDDAKYKKLLNL